MERNLKILICDESTEERERLRTTLLRTGYSRVDSAEDGERAIEAICKTDYDVVIVDLWLSKLDGIGVIRTFSKMGLKSNPAFILTSPINKQGILMEATEAGAEYAKKSAMLSSYTVIASPHGELWNQM